ncbi:MAG: phospho-N-acetylmuramoyl-pentapeptide-transferase [Candidatus Kerfeldbacteria bacterium]|nr:phospho-N-acetylmuramoyl-pentapeptide-transferase [Candidatus Kerfeldbacteria bacterium]
MVNELIRILFLSTAAFIVAAVMTPALTYFLYRYKLGKQIRDASEAPIYAKLHARKSGTPTMGGILVWGTLFILICAGALVALLWPQFAAVDFLSRSETLLPLGALLVSALVGLVDDLFNIQKRGSHGGGLRMRHRLLIYTLIAVIGAWWFYNKLEWDVLHIPLVGNISIGWWYVPVFILVIVATSFAVNETDGLDGLAGGSLLTAYAAYGVIAFVLGRYDLAVFCAVIIGALLAFLWFNIFPARFIMGDTGAMSLGVTLGIIALLTNYAVLLPLIGFVFVIETASALIQMISKRVWKRKIFISAPLHHHLEAIGWPEPKIVMRFWIIAAVMAGLGVMLVLLDRSTVL